MIWPYPFPNIEIYLMVSYLYSIEDQNAVGEDDIKDGDTDKVSVEEFTAVIFRGSEFGMVASSLRPETIFGITNLWINPDEEYHIIDYMGERLAVSSGSVQKLILQNPEIKDLGIVEKDRILYHEFTVPITGKKVPVFPSKFVDPENGTGVVYSVPGHSVWDYVALKDLGAGIEPIKIIDFPEGKGLTVVDLVKQKNIMSLSDTESIRDATAILYREEFYSGIMGNGNSDFSGMSVQEARESIKKDCSRNPHSYFTKHPGRLKLEADPRLLWLFFRISGSLTTRSMA
jgi:Leucyl-tRNA synthetase